MKTEELQLLTQKYRKAKLSWDEVNKRITLLKDTIKETRRKLKAKGKSQQEINNKVDQIFWDEFEKMTGTF